MYINSQIKCIKVKEFLDDLKKKSKWFFCVTKKEKEVVWKNGFNASLASQVREVKKLSLNKTEGLYDLGDEKENDDSKEKEMKAFLRVQFLIFIFFNSFG